MSGYISREAAITALCHVCSRSGICLPGDRCVAYEKIKSLPAADVRPVKRGEWTDHRTLEHDGEWWCTACGNEVTICMCGKDKTWTYNYCPNCGAAMKEES